MEERKLSSFIPSKKKSHLEREKCKFSAMSQESAKRTKDDPWFSDNNNFESSVEYRPKFNSKRWSQYYAAFATQIGGLALGSSWFWTATALPDMAASGEFGEITNSDRAWITSIPMLGAMLVCPITGYCMSRFGRKRSMIMSTLPFAGGWLLIALAPSIPIVYLGRFIIGATSGTYAQIVPIFVAECVEVKIRGTVLCFFEIMICTGTVFVYVVGTFCSWRSQALICGVIPIVGHFLLYFVPESPYFLMERNRDDEAGKSLCWLRRADSTEQVKTELEEISECVKASSSDGESIGWRALKDWSIAKPILLCIGLVTFFQGSFLNAILSAVVEIFRSASSIDEYASTILVGSTQLVVTIIPMAIADKCGRRILLLVSLFFVVLSLISLGTFFHVKIHYGDDFVAEMKWVPLASLLLFVISCSIGIVPISWMVISELTPPKAKGLATTIICIFNRIVHFGILYIFWDMLEVLGQDGTYWTIASICVVGALFIFFCIPETKGKSLFEIQMLFAKPETENSN